MMYIVQLCLYLHAIRPRWYYIGEVALQNGIHHL